MSKTRRVLVVRNAYAKDCGGAEQYALNLSLELKKNGLDPVLMTRVPDLIMKARNTSIPVISGRWHTSQEWGKHYFIRFPLMVLWYMYIIIRYRFDIIQPQGRDDFIFASVAAGILRRRVVWTDHADLKYILNLRVHPFPHLRSWVLFASRFTESIICVSNAELQKISKHAPPSFTSKLITIHNGVASDISVRTIERPQGPLIVSNSRLVQDKGIAELLQMTSRLKDIHLWIVGGYSENEAFYREMIDSLDIRDRVTLWGYVNRPDDYVGAGDIFVHASYHEAFSLAIVEAAMLGKPIVATNVGGAPEIIDEQSGILVPPKDVDTLTNAVKYMIDNPDKARSFGNHIKKKALKEFVFRKIVKEKVIPLYE